MRCCVTSLVRLLFDVWWSDESEEDLFEGPDQNKQYSWTRDLTMKRTKASLLLLSLLNASATTTAYLAPSPRSLYRSKSIGRSTLPKKTTSWRISAVEPNKGDLQEEFRGASFRTTSSSNSGDISGMSSAESSSSEQQQAKAATGTVNERLMAELQQAADKEKYGGRSELTKKFSLDMFKSTKTDEERRVAIEEARNLNGVNPLVTGVASVVALAAAYGLWQATTSLGVFFALHPVESDWYVVQRSTAVFRNVAVGLVSLGAGFCGVTGLGILLLTGRVAVGVAKGELDPTPLPTKPGEEVEIPSVWDLMLNKKPNRRSGGKDLFGP